MTSSTPSDFSGSILAKNLGKAYRLRPGLAASGLKFNELVTHGAQRLFSPKTWAHKPDAFWALRGVSLQIQRGELIGLVGANGSGKSTLLKLLARVTKPSAGHALLRGRVGSLLEVGTGFHPELTGFENIYLCGTILGMSRGEIARKFDEIVAFSEVEAFLNVPIKRLSSGMAMRLGFSVAAHLEPDILLVDEALSVGDAAFQKKCVAKMQTFAASGATVIFVTHDMALVSKSCRRVLLLDKGELREDGPASAVLPRYLEIAAPVSGHRLDFEPSRSAARTGVTLRDLVINRGAAIRHAAPLQLQLTFKTERPLREIAFNIGFLTLDGRYLMTCESGPIDGLCSVDKPGNCLLTLTIPRLDLAPGAYLLDVALSQDGTDLDRRPACLRIEVLPPEGRGAWASDSAGGTRPAFAWSLS